MVKMHLIITYLTTLITTNSNPINYSTKSEATILLYKYDYLGR